MRIAGETTPAQRLWLASGTVRQQWQIRLRTHDERQAAQPPEQGTVRSALNTVFHAHLHIHGIAAFKLLYCINRFRRFSTLVSAPAVIPNQPGNLRLRF